MRIRSIALGCMLAVFAPAPSPAAEAGPDERSAAEVVEEFHGVLISSMKDSDTLGYEGRRERIRPVFVKTLDMDFMAEKSAGRAWKTFDEAQQQAWIAAFSEHTLANYAGRFKGFSGQSFETHGTEEAPSNTVLVKTTLHDPGGDDVQLNYRLRKTADGWRVVDIYMHGTVSELALRRAEYSAAIDRDGIDATIAKLQKQAEDLSANGAE